MWTSLGDGAAIGHVTNGVHPRTWLAPDLDGLLRDHGVRADAPLGEHWERAAAVPDGELWRVHVARKRALAARAGGLDPEALTIGFARRFATYKRAGMLFSQPERLARLLGDRERPLQLVLSGKAHPADDAGKSLIEHVASYAREAGPAGGVVFLEDYDMALARTLVQGVDVWLNTPRKPQEASGTSGMKAALNGVLNVSVLDGWWAEGFGGDAGWAIAGDDVGDDAAQDAADAEELFRVLEHEVVPAFYERGEDGLPGRWIGMMKASIARLAPAFSTHRMVADYTDELYLPAHREARGLLDVVAA
jgi:starch phosphorylase